MATRFESRWGCNMNGPALRCGSVPTSPPRQRLRRWTPRPSDGGDTGSRSRWGCNYEDPASAGSSSRLGPEPSPGGAGDHHARLMVATRVSESRWGCKCADLRKRRSRRDPWVGWRMSLDLSSDDARLRGRSTGRARQNAGRDQRAARRCPARGIPPWNRSLDAASRRSALGPDELVAPPLRWAVIDEDVHAPRSLDLEGWWIPDESTCRRSRHRRRNQHPVAVLHGIIIAFASTRNAGSAAGASGQEQPASPTGLASAGKMTRGDVLRLRRGGHPDESVHEATGKKRSFVAAIPRVGIAGRAGERNGSVMTRSACSARLDPAPPEARSAGGRGGMLHGVHLLAAPRRGSRWWSTNRRPSRLASGSWRRRRRSMAAQTLGDDGPCEPSSDCRRPPRHPSGGPTASSAAAT